MASNNHPQFPTPRAIQKQVDRLFDQISHMGWPAPLAGLHVLPSLPTVDVYRTGSEVVLSAELPGMEAEDVELEVTEDSVRISGEMKHETEIDDDNYFWSERRFGSFSRTVSLPAPVKEAEAKATFKNGVLTLRAPLADRAIKPGPRKVKIEG